jgi:exodeoxyribonuclease VII large subunit
LNKNSEILTVTELTSELKKTLEENFERISVVGEISNFKSHVSGHWYFNLKDSDAVISCTMWKGFNQYVFFTPQDGMKVVLNGRITVYPPRGSYQIDVRSMKPEGMGELQEAFEKLKAKLEKEGLFDEEFKKPIPSFPKKIGIVTAIDGAAFRDMISVAQRRFPLVELVIAPSKVQGNGASKNIAESIKLLNKKSDVDVIIVGRGGGSIEDLWAFNEEIVARAIFDSKIPVISGVGHEVDFTIADYVSDLRAPTPSVAMEVATPDQDEIFAFINEFSYNAFQYVARKVIYSKKEIGSILNSYSFRNPQNIINRKSQQVDSVVSIIQQRMDLLISDLRNKLNLIQKIIDHNNIEKTLKKGFVLVKQNSKFVTRASGFNKKAESLLKFSDGEIQLKP